MRNRPDAEDVAADVVEAGLRRVPFGDSGHGYRYLGGGHQR